MKRIPYKDQYRPLTPNSKKLVQKVIGALVLYERVVDSTLLVAPRPLDAAQAKVTQETMMSMKQLLHYCTTHLNAKLRLSASDMILKIYRYYSYLSEFKIHSILGACFYMETKNNK